MGADIAGTRAAVLPQPPGEVTCSTSALAAVVATEPHDPDALETLAARHGGRPMSRTAAGARFAFPLASGAVRFALALQGRRAAVHVTEVQADVESLPAGALDLPATVGSELLAHAAPGAVCFTAGVLEAAGAELPGRPAYVGIVRLAGQADPVGVYQVFRGFAAGLCPGCGYDLRGVPHRLCPECGRDVGTAALADSRVPWERRHETGAFRAFWATVALASFRPARLARRVSHGGSLPAARSFQTLCRLLAVLCVLYVALMALPLAVIVLSFEGFLGTTPDPVRVMVLRVIIGACAAVAIGCLVAAPVVARLHRRPRQETSLRRHRAAVAHCYASGPLALYPALAAVALATYAYGYLGGPDVQQNSVRTLLATWAGITALHITSHVIPGRRAAQP